MAAHAAQDQAAREGFRSKIVDLNLRGEAREAGLQLAKILDRERQRAQASFCWIAGGETTVKLRGPGRGGRNQELALAAVEPLAGLPNTLFITLASDGEDGPTDSAGAVVTGATRDQAEALGLSASEYLAQNDSHAFFEPLHYLIRCGYTGTNVNDLVLMAGL